MVNPYQPTLVAESTEESGPNSSGPYASGPQPRSIEDRFDAKERRTLRRGLIIIRTACLLALVGIATLGVAAIAQGPPRTLGTVGQLQETIGVLWIGRLIAASIAGFWLGLTCWATLPGNQKIGCFAVSVVLGFGLLATGSFVSRIIEGAFVGGLFRLFGASSFALLLISMAFTALIARGFALSAGSLLAARSCEVAIIFYAICGAVCSSHALQQGSQSNAALLFAMFLAGPVAIAVHGFSQHVLLRQLASREKVS